MWEEQHGHVCPFPAVNLVTLPSDSRAVGPNISFLHLPVVAALLKLVTPLNSKRCR